jgi:hypothetical protein
MKSFSKSGWKLGGETTASRVGGRGSGGEAQETDPLISSSNRRGASSTSSTASSYIQTSSNLRERRKSPVPTLLPSMNSQSTTLHAEPSSSYTRIQDDSNNPQPSRSENMSVGGNSAGGTSYQNSNASSSNANNRSLHSIRRSYVVEKAARDATGSGGSDLPPLVEIPEEIYAVRKAALQVLKPLTRTWVRISVFSCACLYKDLLNTTSCRTHCLCYVLLCSS